MMILEADKIGSATSPLNLTKTVAVIAENDAPRAGDVVVVRALGESVTYGNLELPSGRLAKINRQDVLLGVLGKRRALKGFVGDIPDTIKAGDRLHLLNMGGLIGVCKGHHSSLSDAIEVEVLGIACDFGSETQKGESPRVSKGAFDTQISETSSENSNEFLSCESSASKSAPLLTRGLPPRVLNIADNALRPCNFLKESAPIVIV